MANLKEAFEYASQNPGSEFAKNLEKLASSGSLDSEAKKYSIDLTPFKPKESLGSKLLERGKTAVSEATLQPSIGIMKEGMQETGAGRELAGQEAIMRSFQAPIRVAGAVGGAIGDVVGAGLEATGLDKPIAQALQPVVQSEPVQKAMQVFQTLPKETQDVLGAIMNATNIPLAGGVKSVAQAGLKKVPVIKSVADIKNVVPTKLGQKAVDLISQDPGKKVETILKRTAPEELNSYLSIAEKSSLSGEAKSVFETVGDKLADTTKTLKTKLDDIGAAKSSIIENTPEGRALFKNETTPFIQKLTDIKNGISEIDRANAPKVQAIINDANAIVTKKDADLFIDKVQDALYSGNLDMTIPRGSSLDNKLRGILGEYNNTLKATLPSEYTTLNQQYSKLVDTLDVINRSLGEVVEGTPIRGAGLIKQYFSPAGSKAKEIFEFIKKETNGEVDLAKDATLAKFAGQLYDDPNVGSLLGGIKDIPTSLGAVAGRLIEKIGGEKVESAMRQSTIRKAREKFSPKLEEGSSLKTTTPIESKLSPSPNSTPKEIKGKGIRGMIDPNYFFSKNPAKVNTIVKNMSRDDQAVITDFLDAHMANPRNIPEEMMDAMNRTLGAMNIFVKTKDEMATIGNLLMEKLLSKK